MVEIYTRRHVTTALLPTKLGRIIGMCGVKVCQAGAVYSRYLMYVCASGGVGSDVLYSELYSYSSTRQGSYLL